MTRRPAPQETPVALTVAGSDSGGGAGVQADLKTMEAHGAFGTSVLTAATAQNTRGVESTHVLPTAEIEAQLDAVTGDFDLRAAKTGMLATAEIVELVAEFAADFAAPLVVDPVMVAASGDRLLAPEAEAAYEDLLAEATLATPNADEAEVLTGRSVDSPDDAVAAGEAVLAMGADATLVKGGHLGGETVEDVLVTADGVERFPHPRVDTDASHGSGCALASAIAARLARGEDLRPAVERAVDFMARAVRYHHDVGGGPGAVNHMVELREQAARDDTAERVESLVASFVDADVSPLVPEVGMNVVGATPYAERAGETAAVEGRITRTRHGVRPNRGVRYGAAGHVARFLLAAREFDPDRRFACNVRLADDVEAAITDLGWETSTVDRDDGPAAVAAADGATVDGSTAAGRAFADGSPAAVLDHGAVGEEAACWLSAADAVTLRERALDLLAEVEAR